MHKVKKITASLLFLWCLLPVLLLIMLSFSIFWMYPNILPQHFTTDHWASFLFRNDGLQHSFFISILIAICVSLFATTAGFITAKWIAYHKRKNLLLTITYLPFALSPVIFAVCLKYYFLKAGLAGNFGGIIIAQLIIAFPYSTIFFTSFWNNNIHNYENVSASLGSTELYTFKKIIFPLAKQFLLTCFFQCFLISWFEYGLTNVIGYGKVQTLTLKVYQFISESNIYYAALSSCLLILPPIILLWINKKFILQQSR
jgi:putative spermidine/putrescine transport system permease protein